jgi:hypothetical protein
MRKTWLLPVLVVFLAVPMVACHDEDPVMDDHVGPPPGYRALDGPRDNILFNLQRAYTERNIDQYAELLDNGFLFHFSQNDIDAGIIDHSPWVRAEDLSANKNMFNPAFSKPYLEPVSDIDLVLTYPEDDSTWTPIPPEDHPDYPGETWYQKTVSYRLTVKTGYIWYIGNDIQASFVVRKATVEGYAHPIWRIVSWQDEPGVRFTALPVSRLRSGLVENHTWGAIKQIFAD